MNHSLRDVGKAELRAEVDRPIASQGIEIDEVIIWVVYRMPAAGKLSLEDSVPAATK